MTTSYLIPLSPLDSVIQDPRRTALIYDHDGTLAEYHRDPASVVVDAATREAVALTAEVFGTRAILTGRAARDAVERIPEADLYGGVYGAELLWQGQDKLWRDEKFFELTAEVERLVEQWRENLDASDMRIQVQGPTRLIHWSGVSNPEVAQGVARELAAAAQGRGLRTEWLSQCLDLRPGHVDKGMGIGRIYRAIREAGRECSNVVYFGDDPGSDRDAFMTLRRMQQEGELAHVVCVAAVHPDRPENEPLWQLADLCVNGVPGVRGLTAYLAYAARSQAV